ncbi:hypothetical protein [Streptomyces sp. NPDC090445]
MFPDGVEVVEPCEENTLASVFLTARCQDCDGLYEGPWRRIAAAV